MENYLVVSYLYTQCHNNVVTTSLQRRDVAATLWRRCEFAVNTATSRSKTKTSTLSTSCMICKEVVRAASQTSHRLSSRRRERTDPTRPSDLPVYFIFHRKHHRPPNVKSIRWRIMVDAIEKKFEKEKDMDHGTAWSTCATTEQGRYHSFAWYHWTTRTLVRTSARLLGEDTHLASLSATTDVRLATESYSRLELSTEMHCTVEFDTYKVRDWKLNLFWPTV